MIELIQFAQKVAVNGYEWTSDTPIEISLVSGPPPFIRSIGNDALIKQPLLENNALFLNFADLNPDKITIQRFANKYGLLGIYNVALLDPDNTVRPGCERLLDWKNEIRRLNEAVMLWRYVESDNMEELKKLIEWKEWKVPKGTNNGATLAYYVNRHFSKGVFAIAGIGSDFYEVVEKGSLVVPARAALNKMITRALDGHVSVSLLFDPSYTQSNIHIVPKTLIAALWVQFAQAVNGNKKYRQCCGCRKWMEIIRANKTHCSDYCRLKALRNRKTSKAKRGKKS